MAIEQTDIDEAITRKATQHPILGHWCNGKPLSLSREFMSGGERPRLNEAGQGLIVYEASMLEQFDSYVSKPHFWMTPEELQKTRFFETGDWKHYRLALKHIIRAKDSRTLTASILPRNTIAAYSIFVNVKNILPPRQTLYLAGMLNSFVLDFLIRRQTTSTVLRSSVHQLPVPCLTEKDREFRLIAERAAKLICTTPEFDDLACEIGLKGHTDGTTNLIRRSQLRAELDGLIAHLYSLTEAEFVYILNTFSLVAEPVKVAAQNAYRDVARGIIK